MAPDATCFMGCGRPRLRKHVVCAECHKPDRCDKCIRQGVLDDRMDKRRATIEARRAQY